MSRSSFTGFSRVLCFYIPTKCISDPDSPQPSSMVVIFHCRHSHKCIVITHCDANLHFLNGYLHWNFLIPSWLNVSPYFFSFFMDCFSCIFYCQILRAPFIFEILFWGECSVLQTCSLSSWVVFSPFSLGIFCKQSFSL